MSIALLSLVACSDPQQAVELDGQTMGTSYHIKIGDPIDSNQQQALQQAIDKRLKEINQLMSTYIDDSALMRFNHSTSTEWQPVPAELVELIAKANRISDDSGGQYDVTVGPLVNLWGFGNQGFRDTPPSQEEIKAALANVGYHHLAYRETPPALRKTIPGLQVDLSSIAKGWGVDQIAALLSSHGIASYLVEIGGEVYARGNKPDQQPWRIAVERPLYDSREVERVIALTDLAMATSGDYRNYFPSGGKRYSHTIDPKTGQTVQHQLASVTVIADNCALADAWATALMALGDETAPATAEAAGLKAFFISRTDDGFKEHVSSALATSALWQE